MTATVTEGNKGETCDKYDDQESTHDDGQDKEEEICWILRREKSENVHQNNSAS